MHRAQRKITYALVMLLIILLMTGIAVGGVETVHAASASPNKTYSSAIDDLSKDENFDKSDYPIDATDYSLQVIQIAESTDGELFVYVYQPSSYVGNLIATKINMSLSISVNGTKLYNLKLISSFGVFNKYLVEGVTLKETSTRYYNISTIYRPWDKYIDEGAAGSNTVNGVAYEVGQVWTVKGFADEITYDMTVVETVKIDTQYISSLRYGDGFQFDGTKYTDVYFYSFSTSNKIDRLRSADIEFETTAYSQLKGQTPKKKDPEPHEITLYGEERSNDGSGWFGKKYTWDTLTSTKDFIANAEKQGFTFDSDKKTKLLANDWILNFYEAPYTCEAGGKDVLISSFVPFGFIWTLINGLTTTGEIVSNISLVRLEYDYGGEIYNLGVVANIQTGDPDPVNPKPGGTEFNFWEYIGNSFKNAFKGVGKWYEIVTIVAVVVVAIIAVCLVVRFLRFVTNSFKGKTE